MALKEAHIQTPLARRRWHIRGQVQGVGFRPFVYRLATEWGLSGSVRNDAGGVIIEAQGHEAALDGFAADLVRRRPALAVIDQMSATALTVNEAESAFQIADSDRSAQASAEVTVDTALCPDCLGELLGQTDRRAGYGLINCTNCGPRYSIIRRVPYDRPNTTMAGFHMCPACADEYSNPADRRFHAQPIACHDCGPKVSLVDCRGWPMAGDPIVQAARLLGEGRIVAIKGLGGFHLAVRADDEAAVARLRRLKQRNAKPFAIMCRDLAAARELVELSDAAVDAMLSPACPIVLARRRAGVRIAESVAPDNHRLGVMLPYTPIQHLLFKAMDGGEATERRSDEATEGGEGTEARRHEGTEARRNEEVRREGSGFRVQGSVEEGAGVTGNDEVQSPKPERMTNGEARRLTDWQLATGNSSSIANRKSQIANLPQSKIKNQKSKIPLSS
jgi:hydrogenase maturation protein HypF